ncbi:MAG: phosphatase PAP2 family protein [Alphaproteobacteria bacterium]|nr:phosphatase PAP2 family protein [Alphaproteobacteria bacterium]
MFLTSDNKLKWKRIFMGAAITLALVALGVVWYDRPLQLFIRNFNCGLWRFFDLVFDGTVWIFAAAVALAVFYFKKTIGTKSEDKSKYVFWGYVRDFFDKTKNSYAFYIFASVFTAGITVKILKILIGRMRPVFYEGIGQTGYYPFSFDWAFNSMPSGHTTVTFAGLVMMGLLAPRYKALTWTLAIMVGFSRVAVGAHWPTDVIFGAFLGMVIADIVKSVLSKRN